jgi:hypothetical protein
MTTASAASWVRSVLERQNMAVLNITGDCTQGALYTHLNTLDQQFRQHTNAGSFLDTRRADGHHTMLCGHYVSYTTDTTQFYVVTMSVTLLTPHNAMWTLCQLHY